MPKKRPAGLLEARSDAKPAAPTLSLTMIVKDESAGLQRCLDSVARYVDELVIVDTGSSDDTVAIALRYTDRVYPIPWGNNFAAARNRALELARGDWVLWLDGDDELIGGEVLRQACRYAAASTNAIALQYHVGTPGTPGHVVYWRERVIRRGTHTWAGAAHEVLVPRYVGESERIPSAHVLHHGKPGMSTHSLARNVELLQLELEGQAVKDSRTLFYLARDLLLLGEHERALSFFTSYQQCASWADERYFAWCYMADCFARLGELREASLAALAAVELKPEWPMAYFTLAELAYYRKAWGHVLAWCEIGRRQGAMETPLFVSPTALAAGWIIYYTNALYYTGRLADAYAWTVYALELLPADPQHTFNLAIFRNELAMRSEWPVGASSA